MSKDMPERMSKDMPERMSEDMLKRLSKRRYARKNAEILFQYMLKNGQDEMSWWGSFEVK